MTEISTIAAARNGGVAAIILAAGQSKRLGTPKQLVEIGGESLLRRTVRKVLASGVDETFVVLGHQHELIAEQLNGQGVVVVHAPDFELGLSNSVRRAISAVREDGRGFGAALFVPCDLPLLTTTHLDELIARHESTMAPVVCSKFGEALGIPALFASSIWPEFEMLRGDKGARPIIEGCNERQVIDFEAGALDVDTPEDLERWRAGAAGGEARG